MLIFSQRKVSWPRAILALVWACWPAFLFYMLVLQLPFVSRSRLGLSALLVPFLAFIAYRSIPRFQSLSLNYWLILVIGSGILSLFGSVALSFNSEKTYLLSPQHTLEIEILKFTKGQVLELNRFQTSLGDVSYDSFQDNNGWKRKGNVFVPVSNSPIPLIWTGWTGDLARLYFSGSPGVVINVVWDNQSRVIDLGQITSYSVVEQMFAVPFWGKLALTLVLWGAILYIAAMVLVNSRSNRVKSSEVYLPSWLAYIFLLGLIFSLLFLVLKVKPVYLESLLVLTLASIAIMPIYLIWNRIPYDLLRRLEKDWLGIKLQKYLTPLIFLFSLGLVLGIFGRSLWTNWNIIDDHEIMYFLGPDGKMSFGEIFPMLTHTEIGQFGTYPRFRPSYYFLRLLESTLWGAHPLYWHAFRIVILAFAISLFWLLMLPSLGWLGSGLLCAYALTFSYWADVIGRLGPGETYAVAGLPIYIWGMVNALQRERISQKKKYLASFAIFLGGIICIGSKENFLLLVFPSFYLAYKALRIKEPVLFFSALGTLLFASYVGTSVLIAVTRRGTDIYANSVSPMLRIGKILSTLVSGQNPIPILILIGIIIILSTISLNRNLSWEKRKPVLWAQFWLAVFCLIYLSQLFFYDGFWPTDYRYDFPGLLYIPATIYVLFWLSEKMVSEWKNNISMPALKTSLILALMLVILMKGYDPIIQQLDANIKATNEFTHGVENITSLLREHKDYALVIESGSVADYEPILSYDRFLRAYGVNNKFFLRLHGDSLETLNPGQQKELTSSLVELSEKGNSNYLPSDQLKTPGDKCFFLSVCNSDYLPLDQLKPFGDKCFSLSLSGSFITECKPIN